MLNPSMQYAGFGDVNKNYTMYAIDFSRAEVVDYYAVAYPSGAAFPSDYFRSDNPWTVSVNPQYFKTPDINSVKVTLSGGGQTYEFSGKNSSFEGNYFNVSTSSYGGSACIIFRPKTSTPYSGEYKVTITGLKLKSDEDATLSYTVNFFSLQSSEKDTASGGSTGEPIEKEKTTDIVNGKPVNKNETSKPVVSIVSYPNKKSYVLGEGFDTAGFSVVLKENGKTTNLNSSVTFYTSKTVELTQGRAFTTTGSKVVELRYKNEKIGEYTINVTEKKTSSAKHPFTDVASGAYYENAVIWALSTGVTSGTSATTFAPEATCTRGQVVTFLWRASGSPEPASANNPFSDVKTGDFFYKAVLWAVEKGITSGTGANTFSPGATCTSAQIVTFLWRSKGQPSAGGTSSLAADYKGQYYADAVAWADSTGLLSGTGSAFAPNNNSPRADIVTYLYRNAGSPAVNTAASSDTLEDGTYIIKASKNSKFVIDVPESSKADGIKLIVYQYEGNDNQKFKLSSIGDNKYTIQCVHSGKYWKSSGSKGAEITQAGYVSSNSSDFTFTLIKQSDGSYRIMDSKGFYVGISGGKIANLTNIILWTEASDDSQTYIFEKIG
jgi:hypothetical protein